MSPMPELSESGLSLSWRWAKLPKSHRSETAIPSLLWESLSNRRDQNRPKKEVSRWPESDLASETTFTVLLSNTVHSPSYLPLNFTAFSAVTHREEKDVTYHPFLTLPLLLLSCHWPPPPPLHKKIQTNTQLSLPYLLWHGADGLFFKLISKMYISSRSPSPDYILIFNMKSSLYKQELQHKKLANLCINPLIEFPVPVVGGSLFNWIHCWCCDFPAQEWVLSQIKCHWSLLKLTSGCNVD